MWYERILYMRNFDVYRYSLSRIIVDANFRQFWYYPLYSVNRSKFYTIGSMILYDEQYTESLLCPSRLMRFLVLIERCVLYIYTLRNENCWEEKLQKCRSKCARVSSGLGTIRRMVQICQHVTRSYTDTQTQNTCTNERNWTCAFDANHFEAFLGKETSLFSCMVYRRKSVNVKNARGTREAHLTHVRLLKIIRPSRWGASSLPFCISRSQRYLIRFGVPSSQHEKATSHVFLPMHASSLNNLERGKSNDRMLHLFRPVMGNFAHEPATCTRRNIVLLYFQTWAARWSWQYGAAFVDFYTRKFIDSTTRWYLSKFHNFWLCNYKN